MLKHSARSFRSLAKRVLREGEDIIVNGQKTREMRFVTLRVPNPIDRVVPDPLRKMNLAFAIAEWISLMCDDSSVKFFTQFIKSYGRYSSDGIDIDGAYSKRIHWPGHNGISQIIDILRHDENSRRAVLPIYSQDDLYGAGGLNTPCTLSLHFLIRDGKLICKTTMRSNDIVKGLTNDLFVFTMLQEWIANQLSIPVGEYIHEAHSFHLYESDIGLIKKLPRFWFPYHMAEMPTDFEHQGLCDLYEAYSDITASRFWKLFHSIESQYVKNLCACGRVFAMRNIDEYDAMRAYKTINDRMLRHVTRLWVKGLNQNA